MIRKSIILLCSTLFVFRWVVFAERTFAATSADFVAVPPFLSSGAPPLVMLVMGRDHKLYYEAYNDASDLNNDGVPEIRYTPSIDYYGYFDSYKCYAYATSAARFDPVAKTMDKTCDGTTWSGDYLNYLTMSRMDTIRKVLFGGYRSTDSTDETVLQRVYVPQDAHSWGKEYNSIAKDGYDIAKYTPFTVPTFGRHLFASTTLSANGTPVLRYVLNNQHRIWDWVAKEGPVANSVVNTAAASHPGHPATHSQFEMMVMNFANAARLMGTGSWLDWTARNHVDERFPTPDAGLFGAIDGYGNPFADSGYDPHDATATDQDNYLTIFTGILNISAEGIYEFGVDGDDAVEVIVDGGTPQEMVVGYYGTHGANGISGGVPIHTGSIGLSAGPHRIEYRMEEAGGADRYYLYWKGADSGDVWQVVPNTAFSSLVMSTYRLSMPASTITDLEVKVKVCDPSVGLEANCKQYPDGQYKPIGLLQRHGEPGRMYFGLITGSYAKSTSGGVLRKAVGDIGDEIVADTGQFDGSVNGIIQTLNTLRIYGFTYTANPDVSGGTYDQSCGWITTGPMQEGQCRDWGNPVAEMMYEGLRYFAGKKASTADFDYSGATDDAGLSLNNAVWNDPYDKTCGGFEDCSKPFMLVLSDINPSYDTDQLPGVDAHFGSGLAADLPGIDVHDLAGQISSVESISGEAYIGQSNADSDTVCSAKTVTGLGDIRGLCPEEPTKQGGYYSASVAYYGHKTDLRVDKPYDQKVTTMAVGLASPLPRIVLTLGPDKKRITLVPFGKSVGSIGSTALWPFRPTNTIVDFFVDTIAPTYGRFRINYEDVEQGADHDMDAIVIYEYQLLDTAGLAVSDPVYATQVRISLTSEYASGSYIQHLGYIISGTTADGPYLEVRDMDTLDPADDVFYPGYDTLPASYTGYTGTKLPQKTYRIFQPAATGGATPAQLLTEPLWYAAKWGAFNDHNGDGLPLDAEEWDQDKDGVPDTYYYVTNPLRLEEQLNRSFADILNRASSGTAASVISNTRSGEGAVYQSIFYPYKTDTTSNANTVSWVGQVHGLLVDARGNMREDSFTNKRLDVEGPDLNGNGRLLHEDINMNCALDVQTVDIDGNGIFDTEDTNGNGTLDTEFPSTCVPGNTAYVSKLDAVVIHEGSLTRRVYDINGDGILQDREKIWNVAPTVNDANPLHYLWNSSDWLNSISDADILVQRSSYISNDTQRYLFTWVDGNRDQRVDSTEILDFAWPATAPLLADLSDTTTIYPYLHLFPSFGDRPSAIDNLSAADFDAFLLLETEREIKYIRGLDFVNGNGVPTPLTINGSDIAGTELRARRFAGKTWRLGDVAYSTPTAVGKPAEGYHLLYRDHSYADFAHKYEKRRNVIYAGANDGMLHAFNGGFYDDRKKQFCREITAGYNPYDQDPSNDFGCVPDASTSQPALGAELWAYIPYNLLPHLHWLTETTYRHSYYVDQKPRVFDAKIFPADAVHPHGWGTVMVVGMRFGGARIVADVAKTHGAAGKAEDPARDVTMKSAFLLFDITEPEDKPRLLAEISMPGMGFATSYPTVVVMRDGNHDGSFGTYNDLSPADGENRWFLAFGSGPADSAGDPLSSILQTADSSQQAKFYMLDLVKLATSNQLYSLTDSGSPARSGVLTSGLWPYSSLDSKAFVSDPISVDYNLDYNADVLYYGTMSRSGPSSKWGGKLRRIIIDDNHDIDQDQDPANWEPDSVLYTADQPVSAAPAVGLDDEGDNWVFFGTGRYLVAADGTDHSLQSYYGIKEPVNTAIASRPKTWAEVMKTDLVDTTAYKVFTDEDRTAGLGSSGSIKGTWKDIVDEQKLKGGWYINFFMDDGVSLNGERNLGQATLLGGALTFTTFIPSADICVAGGESNLWAVYYTTGTAFYEGIFGTSTEMFDGESMDLSLRKISLGEGLATSANLHVGSEEGCNAFVQKSTGAVRIINQNNPYSIRSGMRSWKESE